MPNAVPTPPGRNEPCLCGSGRKYKQCCLAKDEAAAAVVRAEAKAAAETEAASAPEEEAEAPAPTRAPRHQTEQPWKANTSRGFVARNRTPRKVGGS